MITIAWFAVEAILPLIRLGRRPIQLNGHWVKTSSTRLECFRRNQKCVYCDKTGSIFLLQSHRMETTHHTNCFIENCEWCCRVPRKDRRGDTPHLNFYHVGKRGGLTLMTQDHIVPKSRGGSDDLKNLQTMCCSCNNRKGDSYRGSEWE